MSFEKLSTEQFRVKMQSKAIDIYKSVFDGCIYSRELDINKDKHFSIDATLTLSDGQKITIQEKFRNYDFLTNPRLQNRPPFPDFTQEYKNAEGTVYENDGEFFKLFAQLYFYGWADSGGTGFVRWCILDVAKYKNILFQKGIGNIGKKMNNKKHGKASFYAIPIYELKESFLFSNFNINKLCLTT
tara:strand:+ start:798 stop:1355 length:558 start_codon:yes stop_codon:yes gene_type:complete